MGSVQSLFSLEQSMLDLNEAAEHMRLYSLKERGKQLRKYRRLWGMDLDYVARLSGLTKSTLSKFERGLNDLRVDTYARVLDAIEQIGETHNEVFSYVVRVKKAREDAKRTGMTRLSALAHPVFDYYSDDEQKEWIANETKNQIDRRRTQSFSETMKERYEAKIAEYEDRIAQLRDLLQLETEVALKASEENLYANKSRPVIQATRRSSANVYHTRFHYTARTGSACQ